ncbi:MAG: ATP-binding protein [Clostridiaceae bacterium]|jgi:predicted AAA+ superfamily ATPase|nr:ATP-binding protein [Bacillota bacterium]NLI38146.1 ATP-binding protein [Clostridiaceae bacterium]
MQNKIKRILIRLESLMVFRDLLKDEVVKKFIQLLETCDKKQSSKEFVSRYSDFLHHLVEHNMMLKLSEVCSFGDYLIHAILYRENSVSKMAEQVSPGQLPDWMPRELTKELNILGELAALSSPRIKSEWFHNHEPEEIISDLPEWEAFPKMYSIFEPDKPWGEGSARLLDFYSKYGSGIFARYKGFIWERSGDQGSLRGVDDPDPVRLSDFIGYKLQRNEIVENTLRFIKGYPANNLLLYGDRGTGKSSTVKALLNEYYDLGLRIIEIPKEFLADFGQILRMIRNRPQKFIAFIDDLSFSDEESSYTALKAVLEGSLENRPENLLVYATTNRRHLIKERFSDRAGLASGQADDEIHAADTMEEKLSLADRFGMTITFTAPDQEEYLTIVEGLADKRGIRIDKDVLHKKAIQWEMLYNGRSPRTALQFINWLEGQQKMNRESGG